MEGSDRDLILGLDFGTSSVKAALFDRNGTVVANTTATYPLALPKPGWAEQAPEDWWQAAGRASRSVEQQTKGLKIVGVGITAQMCGVVAVDKNNHPLFPCPIWLDTRSENNARHLMDGLIHINGYGLLRTLRWLRITGGAPNLSGKDPLSKFLWLKENHPDIWPRVNHLLDVKDYLVTRATGATQTSFDCAHLTWLMDIRKRDWSSSLLNRTKVSRDLLPPITSATEKAGLLSDAASADLGLPAGIPVSVGLGDVCAAAFGSGTSGRRSLHLNIGTSLWFGAELEKHHVDPLHNIGTLLAGDGESHLLIATQENAGACIRWIAKTLGFAENNFNAMEDAACKSNDPDGPFFLPWLFGERVPVDDSSLRGGFLNLSPTSGRDKMIRAVYEGVALNARMAMQHFDKLADAKGKTLRLVGGGARSDFWCQIFSDILGRPLERMESPDLAGARGAAMTAAVACGWHKDIAAASAMTRVERVFLPTHAQYYDARYVRFSKIYPSLKGWHRSRT